MNFRDKLWPLCERPFWGRVSPFLSLNSAGFMLACALFPGSLVWTVIYGVMTTTFLLLSIWGSTP